MHLDSNDPDRPTPDENRLDEALRGKFADFELPPDDRVWAGVAQGIGALPVPQMAPRRRRRAWLLPLLLVLAGFVGGLGGWLLPRPAAPGGRETGRTYALGSVADRAATAVARPPEPQRGSGAKPGVGAAQRSLPPATGAGTTESQRGSVAWSLNVRGSEATEPRWGSVVAGHSSGGRLPVVANPRLRYGTPLGFGAARATDEASGASAASVRAINEAGRAVLAGTPLGVEAARAINEVGRAVLAAPAVPVLAAPAVPVLAIGLGGDAAAAVAAAQTPPATPEQATRNQKQETPQTLVALVALERQTLDQLPALPAPDTAARRALARTLRAERHELQRLQRRADSLLLALGEILPAAPALATVQAAADTLEQETRNKKQETKTWSFLLAAAPEQNYLATTSALPDATTALRRNQETGRAGLAAALLAEYQFRPRLSLGAGLGYTRTGAELRQALRTADYTVRYDTTLTTTLTGYVRTSSTYSIRVVQLPQLSPVFNGSGQVLRYDTVYVPRNDTLRSTVIAHDTVRSTRRVVTPLLQRYERTTFQTLRPDYHFLTLPVLVRYRLGHPEARARWWADVSAGAQLQFFLGGSQLVSADGGATFRTETVGVADGPFRPFNLALSGSVALNYALTSRLSLSFAPTLRWQTLSVFRPETGLRQQATSTGVQVGLRFRL